MRLFYGACSLALIACVGDSVQPGNDGGNDATTNDVVQTGDASDSGNGCGYAAAVASDNPLHYFRFRVSDPLRDEQHPTDSAAAFRNNASVTATSPLGSCGDDGSASTSHASGAVVELLANDYDFSGTNPFTIELWAKVATGSDNFPRIFAREETFPDGGDTEYRWGYSLVGSTDGTSAIFGRYAGDQTAGPKDEVTFAGISQPTSFHHFVGAYDGTTESLYIDGSLVGSKPSATVSIPQNGTHTFVGCRSTVNGTPGDGQFTGNVAEVAVYNHALAAARVKAHYDAR